MTHHSVGTNSLIPDDVFFSSRYLGEGRFQEIFYARRPHPRLVALYALYALAVVMSACVAYFVNLLTGVGALGVLTGLLALLRGLVPQRSVRGSEIESKVVEYPVTERILPYPLKVADAAHQSGPGLRG